MHVAMCNYITSYVQLHVTIDAVHGQTCEQLTDGELEGSDVYGYVVYYGAANDACHTLYMSYVVYFLCYIQGWASHTP